MSETVSGFELHGWAATKAPAGTPREVIAQINAAILKTSRSPCLLRRFDEMAQQAKWRTPGELATLKATLVRPYETLLGTAGVKLA